MSLSTASLRYVAERAAAEERRLRAQRPSIALAAARYESIAAAARAHGLPSETVRSRLRRGWTLEQALYAKVPTRRPIAAFTYRGRQYESMRHAMRSLGLRRSNIDKLRSRGLSITQVLDELLAREADRKELAARRARFKARAREQGYGGSGGIELRGVRHSNLTALAHSFAVNPSTLKGRLRHGWTLEQAVGLVERPKVVRNIDAVKVYGLVFPSMSAAARHFGVSWAIARYRLQVGASPEQAFGLKPFEPSNRRGKPIAVAGEQFPSISDACRRFGRPLNTIKQRLRDGETPEQAFDLAPPPKKSAAVVVDGRPFRFIAEAARYYSVPYARLRVLLEVGVEPMEAVRRARRDSHRRARSAVAQARCVPR